jgi:AcrR family transcriptional regulator
MAANSEATTSLAPPTKRARGRPRSAVVEDKILRAALDALAEDGLAGLSVDRICARAGVPRGSFYRRWSTPVEALLDALKRHTRNFVLEDTGDLAADLFTYMRKVVALNADPIIGVCRAFMATEARIRPDVAAALIQSSREKIEKDCGDLEAVMRRQRVRGPLSAELVLNAIHGVAFNTVADWPLAEDDMKALIATLLGMPRQP